MSVTPPTQAMVSCNSCAFWLGKQSAAQGECRRYPAPVQVDANHWCGDYAAQGSTPTASNTTG